MEFSCACGRTRFETGPRPIASVVCYCDDCQAGSRTLAALPGTRMYPPTFMARLLASGMASLLRL